LFLKNELIVSNTYLFIVILIESYKTYFTIIDNDNNKTET